MSISGVKMEKNNNTEEQMEKNTEEQHDCGSQNCTCPYCSAMNMISQWFKVKDEFWNHLANSKIEFLKAIRTLIDDSIECAEKKRSDSSKDLQKINIEDEY